MELLKRGLAEHLATNKVTLYISHKTNPLVLKDDNTILIQGDASHAPLLLKLDDIRRVVCIGHPTSIDSEIIYRLVLKHIPMEFLNTDGYPQGQLESNDSQDLSLYGVQQQFREKDEALHIAMQVIIAKLSNQKEIVRKRLPHNSINWSPLFLGVVTSKNQNTLRGAEGIAARNYFAQWNNLVKQFTWNGRIKHPAIDPVNYLLSVGYVLLYNRLASALIAYGLNPRFGYFHMVRGRHYALSSDLMEQFRPFVDSTVLTLVRTGKVRVDDFVYDQYKKRCFFKNRSAGYSIMFNAFEQMFSHVYSISFGSSGMWDQVSRSLNDMLDDTAQNYASYLRGATYFKTWRLRPCNAF